MADGGFLIKLGAKEVRGYAVAFDYDEWFYTVNNGKKQNLPKGVERIVIEIERV